MSRRRNHSVLVALILAPALSGAESADQLAIERARVQLQFPAAFAPVADDPALPRVLLIGDSISIGYTAPVRDLLRGRANVHRVPENGGPTTRGLQQIDTWLGDGRWDLIHFNFGLHDVARVRDGEVRTPLPDYERNLRELVARLQATGARLVFATTTPVPDPVTSGPPRRDADVVACNEVARQVMNETGVPVTDLYAAARPRLAEIQRPANVHFTPTGSQVLAEAVAAAIAAQLAPVVLDVGDRRQLFLDRTFLGLAKGVALHVHPPARTGEPVLVSDAPRHTAIGGFASVVFADGVYHLWYRASTAIGGELGANPPADENADFPMRQCLCHARSRDGIHWEKPRLQLAAEFPHMEPNVVLGNGAGGFPESTPPPGAVVHDPDGPADARFLLPLLIDIKAESRLQLDLYASGDGVHWRRLHENILTHHSGADQLDTQNVIFRDARLGRWVAYIRRNIFFPWGRSRAVGRLESDDPARFPPADDAPVVFGWDEHDPAMPGDDPASPVRLVDFYNTGAIAYPWADRAYFMFPSAYFHYEAGYVPEFRERAPKNAGPVDIRFAGSRDGVAWERYDRRPFVSLGAREAWDGGSLYIARGIVPGTDERELYLYHSGSNAPHGWGRSVVDVKLLRDAGLGSNGRSGIGRLVLRRDGFVSVRADYAGGEFTTPPLRFAGTELVLNLDTSAAGEARVELLDEQGAPIPGFSLGDADRLHTTNAINRRVAWRGRSDLSALAGRPIRLRFVLRDADLYAFQFRAPIT